ncbi:MAG TPA: Ig-like domain-containing protein [Polyangiaceae bacterium]|nr:Ig-like domain-containing protein [Polyangiaceae bacterium]
MSSGPRSISRCPARCSRAFTPPRAWSALLLVGAGALLGCAPLSDLDGYTRGDPDRSHPGTEVSSGGSTAAPPLDTDSPAPLPDAGSPGGEAPSRAGEPPAPTPANPAAADAGPPEESGPRVSTSIPADGATGVRRDTSLSIAFTAPMDRASVEAAFSSDTLPAALEFHWDAAGTLLNIVLGAPLAYAAGSDPSQLPAQRYDYRLSSTAHDLLGTPLPETRVSFWTLREISVALSAQSDPALTGNWRSDGIYGTDTCAQSGPSMCLGDSSFGPNASYRGFASFDLSALPSSLLEISQAQLELQVTSILGTPFAGLGQLTFEHVRFTSIGPDAFSAPALASLGGVSSAVIGSSPQRSALDALRSDLASAGLSQYRFRFQSASDGDAATDLVFSSRASVRLRVSYLIP